MFTSFIRTHAAAGRPLSPGTLQRIHATLRAALNAAVRRGLLDSNPSPVRGTTVRVEAASGGLFHLVALLGLRRGEVVGLQ